ncbi:MAG: ROK family protein [Candidatus Symbiobacter sp.]|nr:ROK family protein [Candidatus Symbiobacter sp.]
MGYRIGVDLGGTKIEAALLDDSGEIVWRRRIASPSRHYTALIAAVADLVHESDREARRLRHGDAALPTVGIGIPGTIDPMTNTVKGANATAMNGRPFLTDLETALGRAVRVQNDANCLIMSEVTDGAAAGANVAFGIIIGTGTGGGIALHGKPNPGMNGISGEWGHNPLPWPRTDDELAHPKSREIHGTKCWCGKFDCIETYLSGPGLAADHRRATGQDLKGEMIIEAAHRGDADAEATLLRYEDRMARATAAVINLLDPEVIVLGGGLSRIERLYRHVPELWPKYVFSPRVDTKLRPPRHGDSSGVRGAAFLWSDAVIGG